MKYSELARRYAQSAFDVAGSGPAAKAVLVELQQIEESSLKSPEVMDFLVSPTYSADLRDQMISRAFVSKLSEPTRGVLAVMARKNRLGLLSEVVRAFEEIFDRSQGMTRGELRTASPLSEDEKKKFEEVISQKLGKRVALQVEIDPTLVGGQVIQVGGVTWDHSLSGHLGRMNEELKRRI